MQRHSQRLLIGQYLKSTWGKLVRYYRSDKGPGYEEDDEPKKKDKKLCRKTKS